MVLMQISVNTSFVVSMVTGHHDTCTYIHIYSHEISAVLQNNSV